MEESGEYKWIDRVSNEEVMIKVKETELLNEVQKRKRNCIRHTGEKRIKNNL